ncbi:UPF0547 protein C16orf87 homolog [Ostrea edulis]|uniref:UPF0547 protein C16orf87 homolog n=1 Tax=Ostrea edulis TaxID=37623 RepID=UPI002094275A|nr:UPF0547 protein C16orf87 homolog [Ostrea edulis]
MRMRLRGVGRKRSFDRTVVKKCPKCEQQIPVACKFCSCGHQFWSKKFPSLISGSHDNDSSTGRVRRTERTRRDSQRPDYFNSVVIDTQSKRGRRKSQSLPAHHGQGDTTSSPASIEGSPVKRRRGRPRGTSNKPLLPDRSISKSSTPPPPPSPPVEVDMHADLAPERLKQFQYILMDLNAKYCTQNFKPS